MIWLCLALNALCLVLITILWVNVSVLTMAVKQLNRTPPQRPPATEQYL